MDDVLLNAPRLSREEALALVTTYYGIEGDGKPLPSERDQNYLLQTATGERFVLKIANSSDDRALLEAQNAALFPLNYRAYSDERVSA